MCGRTACTLSPDDICNACVYQSKDGKIEKPVWRDTSDGQSYFPSYNVAPGAYTPVLVSSSHFPGEPSVICQRVIQPMRWGIIPSWHKGDPKKVGYETNNCRAEGIMQKPTYKVPLQKGRRCVILVDGFFEWKRDKTEKQPYFIYFPQSTYTGSKEPYCKKEAKEEGIDIKEQIFIPAKVECSEGGNDFCETERQSDTSTCIQNNEGDKRLLTIAGVFDTWKNPDSSDLIYSYSVITVESSPTMSWIHHRMPAILTTDEEIEDWLNYSNIPLQKALKHIRPTTDLQIHPVSSMVNNSRCKEPDCVKPVQLNKVKKNYCNKMMMNWLSSGVVKKEGQGQTSTSNKVSPRKSPSKSQNLMMNWLAGGKKTGTTEGHSPPSKRIKSEND